MRTTFVNQNSENNIAEAGEKSLLSRAEDFSYFEIFSSCEDEQDFVDCLKEQDFDVDEIQTACDKFKDGSLFHEYGLCFDYVELGTFDDQEEDYFRYQLSYGGPSEEIRFYEDGRIEFIYLDWFSGVGFDVSNEGWAQWLEDWFDGCGSLNFQDKRENYDYYSELVKLDN